MYLLPLFMLKTIPKKIPLVKAEETHSYSTSKVQNEEKKKGKKVAK